MAAGSEPDFAPGPGRVTLGRRYISRGACNRSLALGEQPLKAAKSPGWLMEETALHALMVRGLGGDSAAYSSLLKHLAEALRIYFRRKLFKQQHEAEDLVQDVLLAIHAKRGTFDVSQRLKVWVYAIAQYKLIDYLRRRKRRGVAAPIEDETALFAEEGDTTASADVETLLSHLPEKQRESIRLVKLEELSVREAAEKAGISESDVKVSVHRGLKKLSKIVRDGEG
jgi:RNA polymerase sigma-70 factor (ECF subfamily)